MDPERQRVEQDLRGQIAGEVLCDDLTLQLYAGDASIYQQTPTAVVRPRRTEDVVATVQYAAEQGLSVHPRGAGSGLAGGALGRGVVIDFSRYMRRLLKIHDDSVLVQAGLVHAELNRLLTPQGRLFGPDPASSEVTTLGGVIGVDASGSHWPWFGSTRQHVRKIKAVLASGDVVELGRHPLSPDARNMPEPLSRLVTGVAELARRHEAVIAGHRSQTQVNASGYALDRVVKQGHIDLAKLLVGSEGTLAMVVEAEFATQPIPRERGVLLLMFDSLDKAARSVPYLLPQKPSACDLMDRRHLTIAREGDVRYDLMIPGAAEAVLLVEFFADNPETLREKIDQSIRSVRDEQGLAAGCHVGEEPEDQELLWRLSRLFAPTLHSLQGKRRAAPGIEDIAVPPDALPVFIRHLQDALKRQQITASLLGHAAHGQLHVRPLIDLANAEEVRRMETLASDLYEKVWLLGGVVSGEHGDGLSRTPFLSRQYGPLTNVFRELKRIFDPQGVLNPGKIVPTPGARMTQNLRHVQVPTAAERRETSTTGAASSGAGPAAISLQLNWDPLEMAHAARACNGCGTCRSRSEEVRMCPIFRFAPVEEASPRAKANLVRAVLTGQLGPDTWTQEACKSVADLCVHCHMCRVECPASVDIPKMMVEVKAAHVEANGMPLHDWFFSRIDAISVWGTRFSGLANALLEGRRSRWALEKILGLAQGRTIPRLARRPFLRSNRAKRLERPSPGDQEKVLYFVDTYANHYDTPLAEALLCVLQHNQIATFVPPKQRPAGMPLISQGALASAKRYAERNVEILSESVRQGYTIISTEPSAVLALTREYPMLLDDDEDAVLVASHTYEACHYLWKAHQRGALKLDLAPLPYHVAYHVPCHVRALDAGSPAANLLRLIPELRLTPLEKGCSGMAGVYGLKKRNYRRSLRAGLPLLTELRDNDYQINATECSACAIQMRQAAPRQTLHPIKLLALSYGLAPELKAEIANAFPRH